LSSIAEAPMTTKSRSTIFAAFSTKQNFNYYVLNLDVVDGMLGIVEQDRIFINKAKPFEERFLWMVLAVIVQLDERVLKTLQDRMNLKCAQPTQVFEGLHN
jgi:hypothetical protein